MAKGTMRDLLPHHGPALHYSSFFSGAESDVYFHYFLNNTDWKQRPVKLFGKEIPQPRLTASFADPGVEYGYSGVKLQSSGWTHELRAIKDKVEALCGTKFNTALLNLYRDGKDYMGWHRDNEKNLGQNPVIASVSFGSERRFQLRGYKDKKESVTILVKHGDLLLMKGETQNFWEHRLPKALATLGPRVNITFRKVL